MESLVICLQLGQLLSAQVAVSAPADASATLSGARAALVLRLVDEGYRVAPSVDDAEVVLNLAPAPEGADIVVDGPQGRGALRLPPRSTSVAWLEALQEAVALVGHLGGELDFDTVGLPRGAHFVISGGAPPRRLKAAEYMALAILDEGLALTHALRPGDLVLCAQLGRRDVAVRVGEGGCDSLPVPQLVGEEPVEVADATRKALRRYLLPEQTVTERARPAIRRRAPPTVAAVPEPFYDLQLRASLGPGAIGRVTTQELTPSITTTPVTLRFDGGVGLRNGPGLWVLLGGDQDSIFLAAGPSATFAPARFFDIRLGTLAGPVLDMKTGGSQGPSVLGGGVMLEAPLTATAVFLGIEIGLTVYGRCRLGGRFQALQDRWVPTAGAEVGVALSVGVHISPTVFFVDLIGNPAGAPG